MTRRRNGVRTALTLLLAGLAVAGCASIPTSGPVRQGPPVGGDQVDTRVRVFAVPPRPGAAPAEIVRGFLEASSSSDGGGQRTARLYLTPQARASWRPDAGVVLYDNADGFSLRSVRAETVVLSGRRIGDIDNRGAYAEAAPGQQAQATYRLAQVDGEWRIAALPDGLFLTRFELLREYRAVNLYFFDPTFEVLVPDPVFLPARAGLSTALVTGLLRGPTEPLAPAVRSAFPPESALEPPLVPVENGEARVDLSPSVLAAGEDQRRAMSAQLVWTLRQVPEVTGVRVTVDGAPLVVPGQGDVQSRISWQEYDPDVLTGDATLYWVHRGAVVAYDGVRARPARGPFGAARVVARSVGVSRTGQRMAVVTADGRSLWTGTLGKGGTAVPRLRGSNVTAPSWDRKDLVWAADSLLGRSAVYVVADNGPPRRVVVPELAASDIVALRVAPDGVRVAVVARRAGASRLFVGRIERTDGVHITGLRQIAAQLVEIRDVAWEAADRVVALGRESDGAVQPWLVGVDGFGATPRLPIAGMTTVASAPGRPLVVGTEGGRVWEQSARTGWQEIAEGSQPAYPG